MISRSRILAAGAVIALAAAAVGYQWAPSRTSGASPGALDDGADLLPRAAISLDEAIAAATAASTGAVDEADLEYWNDTLVFNIDVGADDVKVDATTGAVVGVSTDD